MMFLDVSGFVNFSQFLKMEAKGEQISSVGSGEI